MSELFTDQFFDIVNTPLPTWLFTIWAILWFLGERRREKERDGG